MADDNVEVDDVTDDGVGDMTTRSTVKKESY